MPSPLSPKIYGRYADRITVKGECWIWQGSMSKARKSTPQVTVNGSKIRLSTLAMRKIGMPIPREYRMACEERRCLNLDHIAPTNTEVDRMVYINENSKQLDNGCVQWLGDCMGQTPMMPWKKPHQDKASQISVRKFIWCVEYIPAGFPWPTTGRCEHTCGNHRCIKVEHIKMVTQEASAYGP